MLWGKRCPGQDKERHEMDQDGTGLHENEVEKLGYVEKGVLPYRGNE
jgi:hypothetical protein